MSGRTHLGPRFVAELKRRALHPDADIHLLMEQFRSDVGARVLYSEGDGELSILIPHHDDGFDPPKRLELALQRDLTDVLASVPKEGIVEIAGEKFSRYVVEPLRLKKRAHGDTGIGIRGDGWSPLGFGGWFFEDLRLMVDLATREDGFEIRPDVEIDPRDPRWVRLAPGQRAALEDALGRVVPEVIHVSALEEALEKADSQNGALSTALAGLDLSLSPAEASEEVGSGALGAVRPILEGLYGEGALDQDRPFTKAILTLAEDILLDRGRDGDAAAIRLAIRGEAVSSEAVVSAVGRALGVSFAKSRQVSIGLLDRTIDRQGKALGFEAVEKLRDLRAELDHQAQVELLGENLADRTVSTRTADNELRTLAKHLKGRTGVPDSFVFALASRVQSAVNAPKKRPHVIILAGPRGPGVESVLERALATVRGPKSDRATLAIHGDELRLDDPVGYLVGSPAGEAGAAKGRLIQDGPRLGERLVGRIDGLEKIAANIADPEARQRSERAFWGFVGQIEQDGWYRGYDPDVPEAAGGARIDLGGGLLVLTTSLSAKALAERVPEDVWNQLAPHVIEAEKSDAGAISVEIADAIRAAVVEAGGYQDAAVEMGDRARAMIRDLLDAGMKPDALSRTMIDFLVDRVAYGALEGSLSPKLRVDLHRGLTSSERGEVVKGWSAGRFPSLAGIGGCPFVLYDEGRFEGAAARPFSAKIIKEEAVERKELERLRALVAEYQVAMAAGDRDKAALLLENGRLAEWVASAEARIDESAYLNTLLRAEKKDLEHLNKIAEATIAGLQTDLAAANSRIDALNADLAQAKSAAKAIKSQLDVAVAERDQILRALRATEAQFEQAVRSVGDGAAGRDPNDVFKQIIANTAAGGSAGRYQRPMLEQMHLVATSQALERAGRMAHDFNKWREISEMARNYVASSNALGVPVDRRVMEGFERAARLSGNGWERNLNDAWQRDVGIPTTGVGRDPNVVGHLLRQLARLGRVRL